MQCRLCLHQLDRPYEDHSIFSGLIYSLISTYLWIDLRTKFVEIFCCKTCTAFTRVALAFSFILSFVAVAWVCAYRNPLVSWRLGTCLTQTTIALMVGDLGWCVWEFTIAEKRVREEEWRNQCRCHIWIHPEQLLGHLYVLWGAPGQYFLNFMINLRRVSIIFILFFIIFGDL